MKWSFIIITNGDSPYISNVISSIGAGSEIIIIGGREQPYASDIWVPFDESIKDNWITKKKNIGAKVASNTNLCFLHDYVALTDNWFDGFSKFGFGWYTCVSKVINFDGSRFRDFCIIANDSWTEYPDRAKPNFYGDGRLLDYNRLNYDGYERWAYYSGGYFITKRDFILSNPLDETRVHGGGEDVKFVRDIYFKHGPKALAFNPYSTVKLLKQKERAPWENLPPI